MAKFVKLGKKAASFSDPYSQFSISGKQVKKLTPKQQTSPKVARALQGGHLVPATKDEWDAFEEKVVNEKKTEVSRKSDENRRLKERIEELEGENKELKEALGQDDDEPTAEERFQELTKAKLVAYYKETYEVTEEEVKAFEDKNKDEMVAYLVELEKDEE